MDPRIPPLAVSAYTVTSALGRGKRAHVEALVDMRGGLRVNDHTDTPLECHIGRVDGLESLPLPQQFTQWESRNNRLAWLGLQQDELTEAVAAARQRHGAHRIAVLLGTSTGSIATTEESYLRLENNRLPDDAQRLPIHSLHGTSSFVSAALGLEGPCLTISTACSSSAKAFAMAERMLRLGVIDAAVVGGVDSLCNSVLFGFNSLQLVSPEACQPFDVQRSGISIGEAAGFALLQRGGEAPHAVRLVGYGESSDAWHMSTPHPDGLGAELALTAALARAGLDAQAVDYINLHGTATVKNDAVEAALLARAFTPATRASSTKGYTGHTLGAAGMLEAAIAMLAIEHGLVPGNLGCHEPDPVCAAHLALETTEEPVRVALSNSFGFGGNNACLAFAAAGADA